jgi:hypothetical protein
VHVDIAVIDVDAVVMVVHMVMMCSSIQVDIDVHGAITRSPGGAR